MTIQPIRFEATKSKVSWIRTLIGPTGTYMSKYPTVTIYNSSGKSHIVEFTDTDAEAIERLHHIEKEFGSLALSEWCNRYDISLSFFQDLS